MDCPHEDDITHGKVIDINRFTRAVQILCIMCGAVGTQVEKQNREMPEYWDIVDEMWHDPRDYYNDTLAKDLSIGLFEKGA